MPAYTIYVVIVDIVILGSLFMLINVVCLSVEITIHQFSFVFVKQPLTQLLFLFLSYCVGMYDPSKIFLVYFADICEAIEVKPLFIVNRLLSTNLVSSNFKEDVQSMSGDAYDKADKIVNELQRQVKEKGIDFLKAICDFLLNQNHTLRDIGTRMKCQLKSKRLYCKL